RARTDVRRRHEHPELVGVTVDAAWRLEPQCFQSPDRPASPGAASSRATLPIAPSPPASSTALPPPSSVAVTPPSSIAAMPPSSPPSSPPSVAGGGNFFASALQSARTTFSAALSSSVHVLGGSLAMQSQTSWSVWRATLAVVEV